MTDLPENAAARSDRIVVIGVRGTGEHHLTDGYVIQNYPPLVGPTAFLMMQTLYRLWKPGKVPIEVSVNDLSAALGVKPSVGRASLDRLDRFRVGAWDWNRSSFAFAEYLPPVSERFAAAAQITVKGAT